MTVGADACRIQFGYWIERVRSGEDVLVTRRGTPVIRLTAAGPPSPDRLDTPAASDHQRDAAPRLAAVPVPIDQLASVPAPTTQPAAAPVAQLAAAAAPSPQLDAAGSA